MAHILYKLGAAALKPRQQGGKLLPPLLSYDEAMKLRQQFYQEQQRSCRAWPYEHIVPGRARPPAGADRYLAQKAAKQEKKQQRVKEIEAAMAKMPTLIEQYKASRRMDWSEVDPVDLLTMTRTAIRRKYTKRKQQKQA